MMELEWGNQMGLNIANSPPGFHSLDQQLPPRKECHNLQIKWAVS